MSKLTNLWSACERMPTLAEVRAEWRQMLGEEYDTAKVLLRPQAELAASYPCTRMPPCACHHRVVDHGDGDIAAVCQCSPPYCDTIHITRDDLVVYELNLQALCSSIAKALSLQPTQADIPGLHRTMQIGSDSPSAGYRFPVFLSIPCGAESFRNAVFTLAAMNTDPFILITTTDRMCSPECMEILRTRKSLVLTLSEIIEVNDNGMLIVNRSCTKLLAEFHNTLIPALRDSKESYPVAFFPTPPNAAWSNVRIRFLDGHSVSVLVKDKSGVYSFSQMGMSKKNSAAPTAQWKLLEAFAEGRGVFDWESEHANRTQKKQKQLLSQVLREFFRIDGDPFRYVKGCKGWVARFEIEPCS